MYPTIVFANLHLSTFAVAVALACVIGATLGTSQANFADKDPNIVWRFLPWAVLGGLIGGKAYQAVINVFTGSNSPSPFVSSGGLVYYGAITGGVFVAWLFIRRERIAAHLLLDLGAPCVAWAHAIGRIGCFLVGDDYGVPSTLPWAVAFPRGAPPTTAANLRSGGAAVPDSIADDVLLRVHPTQLYEALALGIMGALLWRASRRPLPPYTVFATYLVMYGAWRFGIEFIRAKNDLLPVGLTSAQVVSLLLLAAGVALLFRARQQ